MVRLMSPKDQKRYGDQAPVANTPTGPAPGEEPEKKIQRDFASICEEKGWRYVTHGMHKRSTANRGCPDFIVAAYGQTFWIEFKKPGEELSPDQKLFRTELLQNGVTMYTCTSWKQAAEIIEAHHPFTTKP